MEDNDNTTIQPLCTPANGRKQYLKKSTSEKEEEEK
jgi:hypothetical protein